MTPRRSPPTLSRRAFLAGSAALAAGCSLLQEPPLEDLYRETPQSGLQPPLIVIPGAFGSALREVASGRELWPRSSLELLFSRYRRLAVAFDEDSLDPIPGRVEAADVFEDALGQDFYGALLRTLERVAGYRRCRPGQPPAGGRSYYVFAYDWRLANDAAAQGLDGLIGQIRRDFGDPALRVDLLAHSNGGLIARYYARFGGATLERPEDPEPTAAGAKCIRRLLMVGAPNLGTLQPVLSLVRGEEMGARNIPQEVAASSPGVAQLMPHPALPWLANARGRTVHRDVHDVATWRELRWCIFDSDVRERTIAEHGGGAAGERYLEGLERFFAQSLARGRRFIRLLAAPAPPGDVRPFVFGGDCAHTLTRLVAERIAGQVVPRERPEDLAGPEPGVDYRALMFEPGDLVVTRSSLLGRPPAAAGSSEPVAPLRPAHTVFLCEEHRRLTGNLTFQDNLLHTLLARDAEDDRDHFTFRAASPAAALRASLPRSR